ncbi:MAG: hypothetical protein ACRCU6_04810 [Fusobacteriaceae bacterium]
MKQETRGRKPLGSKRKTYKTIGVRIEEDEFERYNKFIEEKYKISIHTFFRKMIPEIIEKDMMNNLEISNNHELLKRMKQVKEVLEEINKKLSEG